MDARESNPPPAKDPALELFRAAFEAHPQATWLVDGENGRLVAVNEAALRQAGFQRRQMEGRTLRELRAPGETEQSDEALDALCADLAGNRPIVRSLRQRRGDGGAQEVEVSSHAMGRFGERRLRLCTVRDVTEQRRLERAEGRYQLLLQTARDKVLFVSPDGRILDCNAEAERAYGYTREEMLKLRIADLRHPAIEQDLGRQLARATEDGLRFETTHRHRDGSSFPVEITARAVSLGGERVLVNVIRDISDERKARAVLESVEQRLRLMLEEAPLAVLVLDRHGTVEYANPFFLKLSGRPWAEVVGKRAVGAFLAAGPDAAARSYFQSDLHTATGVRQVSWTQSILRDAMGAAEGFLYIGSDMTEQWHSERALRRSEQRFRTLIEGSPDAVALCADGKLTYVNPALEWLIGCSRDEMLGRSALDLLHEGDREALRARLFRAQPLPAGEHEPVLEARLLRKGGSIAYVEIASLPVEADGGPGVMLVARDVTERWQMQSRLLQASRLASVGTLAAGVAHEINNPLAYVEANLGFVKSIWPEAVAELVARRGGASPEAAAQVSQADLDEVRRALDESALGVERVRQIVHGLKEFARSEAEAQRPVDVREALDGSLKMMAQELKHRARVVREIEPVPEVMGNESRLTQVFINLLHNAAQALPAEGAAAGATVRLRTSRDGEGRVVVSVEDTGCGIPPENLPRIFDPFFTTRGVGEGAGLGLSIAHGIVSGMGGDIQVTSTVGQGTTVRVVLPAAAPAART